MTRRPVVDESPISEFVGKMVEAHKRRLRAQTVADKRAIEREMEGFLARYFGRDAKAAMADAEAVERGADVPRATSGDPNCHEAEQPAGARLSTPNPQLPAAVVDRKLASVGPESE